MNLKIPKLSLVVLIGASGSGKSTFARRQFRPTEVLSSDFFRGLVGDDENDQAVTKPAFDALHFVAERRLALGRLTVVDATNVQPEARAPLVALARRHHCLPVAVVLDLPERVCAARNAARGDRAFGPHVVKNQTSQLRRSLRNLRREGFRHVFVLKTAEEVEAATVERVPLWNDRREERGPFDVIGDVHGCCDELEELLGVLGYVRVALGAVGDALRLVPGSSERVQGTEGSARAPLTPIPSPQGEGGWVRESGGALVVDGSPDPATGPTEGLPTGSGDLRSPEVAGSGDLATTREAVWGDSVYAHPEGRKAVFVGDLVDRGPRVLDAVRVVRNMVRHGSALCVPGNHDVKLLKKLRGKDVRATHGLAETLGELEALPAEVRGAFERELMEFLDGLVSHYVLDGGSLVVAHAGMKDEMQGRGSGRVRDFALYGETTGETDEFGLPVRMNWAADYRGAATVVYGHTPVPEPEWFNRTVNVDTGCVFGGRLTALRYPEREFVSVPARRTYCEPARPFLPEQAAGLTAQQELDTLLDAGDVLGKRLVSTRLRGNVTVREENATAALEVMSRFAADPRWLVYLPPTMSPSETTTEPGLLEHPAEAFAYYRNEGCPRVVCEEKHMGSRAVAVVCRDAEAARRRFGVETGEAGLVYTRTGRRFFTDAELERRFLHRLTAAVTTAGWWEAFQTAWVCLDCELMPWSAKAQELLKNQYAAVGAAGRAAVPAAVAALERATAWLDGEEAEKVAGLLAEFRGRRENVDAFVAAYRRYCWPVESLDDLKLAPFHLLATEGRVHTDRDHVWHMETLAALAAADPGLLLATPHRVIDVTDEASQAAGVVWWEELTARGGEGMVVKPLEFVFRGRRGLAQPAVKCRGREYLRIIYGPDYDAPENLARLRRRGLGAKRSLALREFALGVEALERFVRREPLRRVHECVFGVLALESEPVDPRL